MAPGEAASHLALGMRVQKFAFDLHRTIILLFSNDRYGPEEQVLHRVRHGLPARDGVARKSELGTVRHQLGLQRPSMPIRSLISEMPSTFTKLAPCVLMSPLCFAQYLPAGKAKFREDRVAATQSNEAWAMDFVHDQPVTDRKIRVRTIVDTFSIFACNRSEVQLPRRRCCSDT